jgi:acyl-CoA thioesterase
MTDGASSTPTPVSSLFEQRVRDGDRVTFSIPPDWMQGRTSFGGLIAAVSVQAMRDVTGGDWPLRALQTSFIGPVGGAARVQVTLLRQGKNVRQVQAVVESGGATAAVLLGVFGATRTTAVPAFAPERPSVVTEAAAAMELPFVPGFTPTFTQHFQSRWGEGEFPFSNRPSPQSRIHTRLRDGGIDRELACVLLADMPPTPVLSYLDKPAAASSVSWELELLPLTQAIDWSSFWRIDTEAVAAAHGYVSQRSHLWSPSGELAALGYQVVSVYG